MEYFWRNNSTPVKIFAILFLLAIGYLFFVDGEEAFGWTAFFVFLGLTILFKTMDEKEEERRK